MAMLEAVRKFFVEIAAGEVAKQLVGVAAHVVAGPAAGLLTYAKRPIEKLIVKLADKFWAWKERTTPEEAAIVIATTANMSQSEAKELASSVIQEVGGDASSKDKELGVNLLAGLATSLRQSLPRDAGGKSVCPVDCLPKDKNAVLGLMPTVIPPFVPPCQLPNSPYFLMELCGMGGFGAVYKACVSSENEYRAIKVCLDQERVDSLRNEHRRLDQLKRWTENDASPGTGVTRQEWADAVVSLYGHQLESEPHYLVYEFMPDGDLTTYFHSERAKLGRQVTPDEVFSIVRQIAVKLGVVHRAGIVHRDLKPTNILLKNGYFKIGDFGLGTSVDPNMYSRSRVQSSLERSQQFRGAGTPIYMSDEQAEGQDDCRNDVFSLGVIWYQLIVGDFSRRIPHGWEDNVRSRNMPEAQIKLLARCIRSLSERPGNGTDLVRAIDSVINREEEIAAQKAIQREQEQKLEIDRLEREKAARKGPVLLQVLYRPGSSFDVWEVLDSDFMKVIWSYNFRRPARVYFDGKLLKETSMLSDLSIDVNTHTGSHELVFKYSVQECTIIMGKFENRINEREHKINIVLEYKGNATAVISGAYHFCVELESISNPQ